MSATRHTSLLASFALALAFSVAAGCSDTETDPTPAPSSLTPATPGTPEAGTSETGTPASPSEAAGGAGGAGGGPPPPDGGCSTLVGIGAEITTVAAPTVAPPATGGTLADGTYVLTRSTLFTGPGGESGPTSIKRALTLRITGSTAEVARNKGAPQRASLSVAGSKLNIAKVCPKVGSEEVEYTATPTSLSIFETDSDGTALYFFEKR